LLILYLLTGNLLAMTDPLVSIIMPTYNAEKFIGVAIKSIINQTYINWELIVIDDGSTDDTATIVKSFSQAEKRIVYQYQQNTRQGLARNNGLRNANADLIAFLDSDDLWLPNRLELTVTEFMKGQQDLLFAGSYTFDGDFDLDNIKANQSRLPVEAREYAGIEGLELFLNYNQVPMLTTLIKREALLKNDMFGDRGICEDYEMWLKMLLNGCKFRPIAMPLAAYREHSGASTYNDKLAIDNCIDVIYSLKTTRKNHVKLLNTYLNVWYLRKLETISNFRELRDFYRKLRLHKKWNYKLSVLSGLNFNIRFLYNMNKSLTRKILCHP